MKAYSAQQSSKTYRISAARCLEVRPLRKGKVEFFPNVAIVLLAFSSELGIKSLLMREAGPERCDDKAIFGKTGAERHNLSSLFEKLVPEMRERIRAAVPASEDVFDAQLAEIGTVYSDIRYIHERDGAYVALDFLTLFTDAVQKQLDLPDPVIDPAVVEVQTARMLQEMGARAWRRR